MSGTNAFPAVPMLPASHPVGAPVSPSPLATAMMGRSANFSLPQTGGNLSAPLISMLMAQQGHSADPAFRREGFQGGGDMTDGQQWGNVLQGYQWDGMPGQSPLAGIMGNGMAPLTAQATTNASAIPGGQPTDPYGSAGRALLGAGII